MFVFFFFRLGVVWLKLNTKRGKLELLKELGTTTFQTHLKFNFHMVIVNSNSEYS